MTCGLEREENIVDLLSVAWPLYVGQDTPPAVCQARFGDLFVVDRVARRDVLRPHNAGNREFADLGVAASFLPSLDNKVSVRQHLHDDSGHFCVHFVGSVDLAVTEDR